MKIAWKLLLDFELNKFENINTLQKMSKRIHSDNLIALEKWRIQKFDSTLYEIFEKKQIAIGDKYV